MTHDDHLRLFVSFPEAVVGQPVLYEMVKRFDVVPNIRRADVEGHSGWIIFELSGSHEACDEAVAYLESLGCTVNPMEGDVVAG